MKSLGTPFDGTNTVSSAMTFATGSVVTVTVPGLTAQTSYHWRARAISATLGQSPWVSFGANAESAVDFSSDNSTTSPPTGLQQFEVDGATAVPLGGLVHGAILLGGVNGTNSAGQPVRIEVEVQPTGTAFANVPSVSSGFGAGGAAASALFSGAPTNDYRWQARSVNSFGVPSTWVNFNAAAVHFHMEQIVEIKADAGCAGSVSSGDGAAALLWGGAGLALLLLALRKRSAAASLGALLLVAALSTTARADEDFHVLPRSLSESLAADPAPAEPFKAQVKSWGTFDAYLGVLLMDLDFEALGTDFVQREVSGIGTAALGIQGLVDVLPEWRVGVMAELGYWSDVQILAAGPVVTWCFSGSHRNKVTGLSDTEHYLKLALLYEKLEVKKTDFGDFDATFGVRVGYELRLSLGDRWQVLIGATLQYAQWDYDGSVRSGDDTIGGFGGMLSIGVGWLP